MQEQILSPAAASSLHKGEWKPQATCSPADTAVPKPSTRKLCYFGHAPLGGKYVHCFMRILDFTESPSSQLHCLCTRANHSNHAQFVVLAEEVILNPLALLGYEGVLRREKPQLKLHFQKPWGFPWPQTSCLSDHYKTVAHGFLSTHATTSSGERESLFLLVCEIRKPSSKCCHSCQNTRSDFEPSRRLWTSIYPLIKLQHHLQCISCTGFLCKSVEYFKTLETRDCLCGGFVRCQLSH